MRISISKNLTHFKSIDVEWDKLYQVLYGPYNWSPATFNHEYRTTTNWINDQHLLVLDFDLFIGDPRKYFHDIKVLICPTRSNMQMKNQIICQRFRAVFPLKSAIKCTAKAYTNAYRFLAEHLGSDVSSSDVSRFYFPYTTEKKENGFYAHYQDGDLLDFDKILEATPKIEKNVNVLKKFTSKKPKCVDDWSRMFKPQEIPQGERNNTLARYALWMRDLTRDRNETEKAITWVNDNMFSPLPQREITSILKSAFKN